MQSGLFALANSRQILREGEAPAEPRVQRFGMSLTLPKVFNAIDFAKLFTAVASPSRVAKM